MSSRGRIRGLACQAKRRSGEFCFISESYRLAWRYKGTIHFSEVHRHPGNKTNPFLAQEKVNGTREHLGYFKYAANAVLEVYGYLIRDDNDKLLNFKSIEGYQDHLANEIKSSK